METTVVKLSFLFYLWYVAYNQTKHINGYGLYLIWQLLCDVRWICFGISCGWDCGLIATGIGCCTGVCLLVQALVFGAGELNFKHQFWLIQAPHWSSMSMHVLATNPLLSYAICHYPPPPPALCLCLLMVGFCRELFLFILILSFCILHSLCVVSKEHH